MANPHLVSFLDRLERRYSIDAEDMSMSSWIEKNTKLKSKPFSFKRYEFQRSIVDDLHPNLDCMKCSQVGLSEVQIRKMLAFLRRHDGTSGIFTLPNEKMYKKMSTTRIKPLIESNPVFTPSDGGKMARSMSLMQFGQSFLHITGATEGDATSTPADILFNDEVDLTDQAMLSLFNSRLQNSDWKIRQRFSTPTFMDYGIDLSFKSSDQHEFLCKCRACGHHNIPDFEAPFLDIPGLTDEMAEDMSLLDTRQVELLDLANAQVVCEKCRAPLDLDDVEMREWVPRFPARSQVARGYRVRPFVTSRIPIPYIISQLLDYKQREYVRGWYNTVLGRPYTAADARLTEEDIRANMVSAAPIQISKGDPVALGIDVGQTCHVTIGKPGGDDSIVTMNFLEVPSNEITTWVKDFRRGHNLIAGAMDRHPYTPTAEAVFEASGGKVFPVEYRGQRDINPVRDEFDAIKYFQANRTQLIDSVASLVRARKLPMAGYGHKDHIIVQHLRDMVRDETPEAPATWRKLTGSDHYFHALGFLVFSLRVQGLILHLDDSDKRIMTTSSNVTMKSPLNGLIGHGTHANQRLYRSAGSLANLR